jgi:CheY-like chemotaxis protein
MSSLQVTEHAALAILIVDDEVNVAAELADAAEDEGYIVHQANSAGKALAILTEHPEIGVMISDIRMPDCDGLELTRRVLEGRDDSGALEVILITGHATLDDAVMAVRTGAFDFVRKPFRLQQIFEATARAMARAIGRRRIAAALGAMEAQRARPALSSPPAELHGDPEILLSLMHELRTPLVPILGFAEVMETQRCSPADISEFASLIGIGGRQLLSTVDDLVLLAQMERGEIRLVPRRLAAGDFLQALADAHRSAAEFLGTSLKVSVDQDIPLFADSALTQRAIDVLLRIALQRAPRGTVVTLSATRQAVGVRITIGANGVTQEAATPVPTAFAEDVARHVAPLGIRFVRAILAMHGGELTLAGDEHTAFSAFIALPDGPG